MNLTTGDLIAGVWWEDTQKGYAAIYARGLRMKDGTPEVYADIDWPTVNRTIIERWSMKGLQRIKKLAWKLAEASL